jgi:hypothetical protein
MDFTKIECISQQCKGKHIIMGGAGASLGGRITVAQVKCHVCELTLMIVPMNDKYKYSITATTEEERTEERIKKAKEASELELAKTITRIKETEY